MTEIQPDGIAADELKKLELRFRLLKDEISSQANTFDQIDSKTGVAIGFTFVVIAQVLAVVFRMALEGGHFHSQNPAISDSIFALANLFAVLAIACGVTARWPCEFQHSITFNQEELSRQYPKMLDAAFKSYSEVVTNNEGKNAKKARWAQRTYFFVTLALLAYLALTIYLYFSSIAAK